jgi:hypothetical protein
MTGRVEAVPLPVQYFDGSKIRIRLKIEDKADIALR